jgi:hypothetical protein
MRAVEHYQATMPILSDRRATAGIPLGTDSPARMVGAPRGPFGVLSCPPWANGPLRVAVRPSPGGTVPHGSRDPSSRRGVAPPRGATVTGPGPSAEFVTGSPTPVDATCLRCRREGMHNAVLYVLSGDGPRRVGEITFCVCETRPASATITSGVPRRTGARCVRCDGDAVYEVPLYAVSASGVAPHTTRTGCSDCDERAAS